MKSSRSLGFAPLLGLAALAVALAASVVLQFSAPSLNAEPAGTPTFKIVNPIDQFVLARLQTEKIEPSGLCTDEEFLRRVYLDLNGSLPPLAEVKSFLADRAEDKRAKLIDRLLKSERYGDHWSVLWSDLLREHSNSRPREGTERGSYRTWIQDALNKNMPYDFFVKSLIDAVGNSEDDAAVNFYLRDENNRVETVNNVSNVFMGTRMACAQCHDHPFDKWTQNDFHSLMAFFTRTNVQVDGNATLIHVENNRRLPAAAKPILEPYFKEAHEKLAIERANYRKGAEAAEAGKGNMMGGMMDTLGMLQKGGKVMKELEAALTPADMQTMRNMLLNQGIRRVIERPNGEYRMPNDGDAQVKNKKGGNEIVAPVFPWDRSKKTFGQGSRRAFLAEFVTGHRQFAAVQANRLWAGVFGRGIVDPLDDFREKNPPSNPDLLDYLTDEFIKSKFDNKHLLALICNSSTYQRSSTPNASNRSDNTLFSHARVRRMSAEQLFDSILVATGKNDGLTGGAALGMGMGREMIGDKVMNAMYGQKNNNPMQWAVDLPTPARTGSFMNSFNQPDREQTLTKRDESGSIPQALEMLNGATVNGAIKGSPFIKTLLDAKLTPAQIAHQLYLSVLTRPPTPAEVNALSGGLQHALAALHADAAKPAKKEDDARVMREWVEDVYWALMNAREFTFVK